MLGVEVRSGAVIDVDHDNDGQAKTKSEGRWRSCLTDLHWCIEMNTSAVSTPYKWRRWEEGMDELGQIRLCFSVLWLQLVGSRTLSSDGFCLKGWANLIE